MLTVFRGFNRPPATGFAKPQCALTIGNFDGVHRGHQAMLALLKSEARHRNVPSIVMTFEPHPRDYFARLAGKPELAPMRIATLRDKVSELVRCGIDQVAVLPFSASLAQLSPQDFIDKVLVAGMQVAYVLVGDDFRFGAKRAGDYAMLDAAGSARGFDVARMMSYEVHGLRVSSSAVRAALGAGDMSLAASLLGRPYAISGHVAHGQKLGRSLGFRTLNLAFGHEKPAAMGIFVARVHGLRNAAGAEFAPLDAVASLGVRPTVENAGRVLLEAHALDWPAELGENGGYGQCVSIELLHKLHDERKYANLAELRAGISADTADAVQWFARA